MEAMTVAQRMSAEEFLALPEQRWAQLIEGEIVLSQPNKLHQSVLFDLLRALSEWTEAQERRGEASLPLDVQLDDANIYAPDIMWYRAGSAPARHDPPPYPLPDLAVEIRSPSTWRYDVGAKKSLYERHGLLELWLVDTAADEVLVFRRSKPAVPTFDLAEELARGDTLISPLLPGFSLALDELFVRL